MNQKCTQTAGTAKGHTFDQSSDESGAVNASAVVAALRENTFLVSVMHVNNETGIIQPIDEIATGLSAHGCYFHVGAAQGFGG